jgi:predicted AAA+ superfamily ATPase
LCAKSASGTAGSLFYFRDAHGTEVDFVIEHAGRVRLLEAKWVETVADRRAAKSIEKVSALLGKRAAEEHWIVCRTPHAHRLPGDDPAIRLVNGFTFDGWFPD